MRDQKRRHIIFLVILLWAAFTLRIFRIENQSFWWDEGISLHLATSPWSNIVADRLNNIHPPLYFFLLKVWVNLTGLTPFATRTFSALASLMQVAAVYTVGQQLFKGRPHGVAYLSALFITISPLSIIYGQEVRVYAFLPLIYFTLIGGMNHLIHAKGKGSYRTWLFFGVIVWVGLHLHYIAAFMVLYCGLWGLLAFYTQKEWPKIRALLLTATAVFFASLPWFILVARNLLAVQSEANAGTFLTEPVPVDFLLKQIWIFHLTGLAGSLRFEPVVWSGTAVAILALLLLLLTRLHNWYINRSTRQWITKNSSNSRISVPFSSMDKRFLLWTSLWFVPLFSALIVWSVRSFSHPRYISMFAMGLFPLLAHLAVFSTQRNQQPIILYQLRNLLGIGLITAVFIISGLSLYHYFINPDIQKDDMRGVARYLETAATPKISSSFQTVTTLYNLNIKVKHPWSC